MKMEIRLTEVVNGQEYHLVKNYNMDVFKNAPCPLKGIFGNMIQDAVKELEDYVNEAQQRKSEQKL